MKTRTKLSLWLGLVMAVIATIIGIICLRPESKITFADQSVETEEKDGFIVSSYDEDVAATYTFVRLNDTECSVRINNKSEATKAIVPSIGKIDGIDYKVTTVANSGFSSSPKLVRVSLPYTIKKIGASAFSNCAKLNRINLSNVEEIGNSAFMRCPSLSYLVIPKSVTKIGTYILRNNNTQVRARAEEAGANWASTWNSNNTNQEVEYGSNYVQPLELEPIYNPLARSAGISGYALAGGQPRTDIFYSATNLINAETNEENTTINDDNTIKSENDKTEWDNKNNVFIPAKYKDPETQEEKEILKIADGAFAGANFNQLIIEYSPVELIVESFAFSYTSLEIEDEEVNITINRSVKFFDQATEEEAMNIFEGSNISTVVLPNTLTTITPGMFTLCEKLKNIFFNAPTANLSREEELKIIGGLKENNEKVENGEESEEPVMADEKGEGIVVLPGNSQVSSIGEYAFVATNSITKLILHDSIETMGTSIIDQWNDNQYVYVNNMNKKELLNGWNPEWHAGFVNIEYAYKTYQVTFDSNGGTFVGGDQSSQTRTAESNQLIQNVPIVERRYSTFVGWFTEENEPFDVNQPYSLKSDVTLKAKWEKITCTVKLDMQNEEGEIVTITATLGEVLPSQNVPTRKGYKFSGFFSSKDNGERYYYDDMQGSSIWVKTETTTIYAHWDANEYTITLNHQNGSENYPFSIKYAANMPGNFMKPEKENYDFQGYYTEPNGGGDQYYDNNMNSDKKWNFADNAELFAHWTAHLYTITYSIADMRNLPENYGNEERNIINYTCETTFPIQINSFESYGYRISWTQDVIEKFSDDITVIGSLELLNYDILYEGLDGATNHSSNPGKYNVETHVELYDPSHPHHKFTGWELDGEKITNLDNRTGNIKLTATWSDIYTIYINKSFTELIVDQPKVSIEFNVQFKSNCTIKVNPETTLLGINGNGYAFNMNINILQRTTDFGLLLYDIGIQAHSTKSAISMPSSQALHLYTYKNVIIKGCVVAVPAYSPTDLRVDGVVAISCGSLIIHSSDYLFIQGGSGYKGGTYEGNGLKGGNGAAGVRVDSQVIIACDNVIIAGGYAGNGGDSVLPSVNTGKGGNGADPIVARKTQSIQVRVLKDATNIKLLKSADGVSGGFTGLVSPNPGEPPFYDPTIPPSVPGVQKPPVDWDIDVPIIGGGDHLPTPPFVPGDPK